MKVKIRKFKNLRFSREPIVYDLRIKNNGEVTQGVLTIDFPKDIVSIDIGRELSKEERLDILKEVYDKFVYEQRVKYSIEKLKLKDVQSEEKNKKTIIEELLKYDLEDFNTNIESQMVIYEVIKSYDTILTGIKNGCNQIELQDIVSISRVYEEYERVLKGFLQDHGRRRKIRLFIYKNG